MDGPDRTEGDCTFPPGALVPNSASPNQSQNPGTHSRSRVNHRRGDAGDGSGTRPDPLGSPSALGPSNLHAGMFVSESAQHRLADWHIRGSGGVDASAEYISTWSNIRGSNIQVQQVGSEAPLSSRALPGSGPVDLLYTTGSKRDRVL